MSKLAERILVTVEESRTRARGASQTCNRKPHGLNYGPFGVTGNSRKLAHG